MKAIHKKLLIAFTATLCATTQAITLKQMLEQTGEGITETILKLFGKQKKSNVDNHLLSAFISGTLSLILFTSTYQLGKITGQGLPSSLIHLPGTFIIGSTALALGAYSLSQIRKAWEERRENGSDIEGLSEGEMLEGETED